MKPFAMRSETRITLWYLLFGGLWILLSDTILFWFIQDPAQIVQAETYKGWAYVLFSGGVIYLLISQERKRTSEANARTEESEERYRKLFENSLDAIILTAPDGTIFAANPAACAMFGRHEYEIIAGGRSGIVDTNDPRLATALETRARLGKFSGELTFLRADGSRFQGEISTSIYTNRHGQARTSMIIRDISQRIAAENEIRSLNAELEQRVIERTGQLSAANKELESFTYSVSHDLRAPLRAINGFASILSRRHKPNLNDEGQRYLDNIIQASERMGQLIDSLLTYGRLGRAGIDIRAIGLESIFPPLLADLKEHLKDSDASIVIKGQLPVVRGDESLLRQIFSNLLENALVYRKKDVPLTVTIEAQLDHKQVIVSTTDNGIGIPVEYQGKIFNIFQRLHNEDDYPGTGIGLATVRKAVELLGGEVWVSSVLGEGSTFYVRLTQG